MSEIKDYDCWGNEEILCPYCGEIQSDPFDFFEDIDGEGEFECGSCEKDFKCYKNCSITYSTEKIR